MKSGDIVEDTRKDLERTKHEAGSVQAVIDFNCGYRFMELKSKNLFQEYSNLFRDIEAIGFGTFGESYIGHMNQTSTMLLLK